MKIAFWDINSVGRLDKSIKEHLSGQLQYPQTLNQYGNVC